MIVLSSLVVPAFGTRREIRQGNAPPPRWRVHPTAVPNPALETAQTVNRLIAALNTGTYNVVPLALYEEKTLSAAAVRQAAPRGRADVGSGRMGFKHFVAEIQNLNGENYLCEAQINQKSFPAITYFRVRLINRTHFLSAGFLFPSDTHIATVTEKDIKLGGPNRHVYFLDWTLRDDDGHFLPVLIENRSDVVDRLQHALHENPNYTPYKGDLKTRRQALGAMLSLVSAVTSLPARYPVIQTNQNAVLSLLTAKSQQIGVAYENVLDACKASGVTNKFFLSDTNA